MTAPSRIAYADCFSGVSGDMFLGALLHCGLPETFLRQELAKLDIGEFSLAITNPTVCGIGSCKVDIEAGGQQNLRHLHTIRDILENSKLDDHIISTSLDIFTELARAEAKVHNTDIKKIHFHEVGAVDTIIDIVGTVAGLRYLGINRLIAAPIPCPRGFVKCAHGTLPLPAPAVLEILAGVPCYGVEIEKELVTPTGAALLKVLADDFGSMPPMVIDTTGYGAGSHSVGENTPNLFRLILGNSVNALEHQEVEVLETNIDDCSPEIFPYLFESLLSRGALDVSVTPIQMKKGRSGFKLQVISPLHLSIELRDLIFCETTSIGMRHHREQRHTLPREHVEIETPWGKLAAKKVITPRGDVLYPEYEACRRVALDNDVPLQQVYDLVKSKGTDK
jgi:uncharacterized protein (TIGR00299 family) protein